MPNPAKRPATHAAVNAANASPGIPDDLTARLRSLGSRIRKQVTEGYATSPSPHPSPSKSPLIFQSAKDTLRDVFHSQPSTPSSSPRKRTRPNTDQNGNSDLDSDVDMMDDELPSLTSKPSSQRPIKPLRTSKRVNLISNTAVPSPNADSEVEHAA
ncbi:hypothetical protein AX15_002113 [Amanita polypyramis BW_CC]|nr:hypothetical protein AX15_002113 [Amanita polypyramis BW_CC]